MSTPSRREFFTYAAAATLAPALPASAQTKNQTKTDTTLLPLVVDVIGPMALRWSGKMFELWMPDLSDERHKGEPDIPPHQAGIMTTVTGIELKEGGQYQITGPLASSGNIPTYSPQGAQVYQVHVQATSAHNSFIYMLLPMPECIVVLDPVVATISGPGTKSSGTYAVGVRLLYQQAGKPELLCSKGRLPIPFYKCPAETQTNMMIGYLPYNTRDDNHADAKKAFNEASKLFLPQGLNVEFQAQAMTACSEATDVIVPDTGPLHDCKSPVIGVGGSS